MSPTRPFTREQRATIVFGMLAFVLILVILQLWLLTATMNAYLGGDESVIWPAAGASTTPSSGRMRMQRSVSAGYSNVIAPPTGTSASAATRLGAGVPLPRNQSFAAIQNCPTVNARLVNTMNFMKSRRATY